VKDHDEPLGDISFVPFFEDITIDYEPGTTTEVTMHDGSRLLLHKLERDYDPTDKVHALTVLHEMASRGELPTGVLYVERDRPHFIDLLNVVDEPLASLPVERVRPPRAVLDQIMEGLR
jgi:2-oxoglutarate ferredoxin oxidoreductase subunit beta